MRVAQDMHQVARHQAAHLGDQAGQKSIRRDVKGDAQANVARPLVHLAGQLAARHVELAEHVAGRQRLRSLKEASETTRFCMYAMS